jgi:hypothetical protein
MVFVIENIFAVPSPTNLSLKWTHRLGLIGIENALRDVPDIENICSHAPEESY